LNKRTGHPRGSYAAYLEAVQGVIDHVQALEETQKKIDDNVKKFDDIKKKTSLNERYKNVEKQAKPKAKKETHISKYLERLADRAKYAFQENKEKIMERNWKLGNVEYMEALMNH
jgi:uncharacterized protein (DUF3084 family)